MGRFSRYVFILFSLLALNTGCSVAVPDVTSLLSNLASFKLNSNELRISALSELSTAVSITAICDNSITGFEYEIPETAPGTWLPVPTTASGMFTSATNNCSSSGTAFWQLDLSSVLPFSTMTLGQTKTINFRDINELGISSTESFSITYSFLTLSDGSFINGQGFNDTKTSGSYTLRGRVSNVPQLPSSTSGSYTLQGKIIFR